MLAASTTTAHSLSATLSTVTVLAPYSVNKGGEALRWSAALLWGRGRRFESAHYHKQPCFRSCTDECVNPGKCSRDSVRVVIKFLICILTTLDQTLYYIKLE